MKGRSKYISFRTIDVATKAHIAEGQFLLEQQALNMGSNNNIIMYYF